MKQAELLAKLQSISTIFPGERRITPKIHSAEHHLIDVAKWGRFCTHSSAPGESALRDLKEACFLSKRTMAPALINYACVSQRLQIVRVLFDLPYKIASPWIGRIRQMLAVVFKSNDPSFHRPGKEVVQSDNFKSIKRYYNSTTEETIKIEQVVQKKSRDSIVEIDYNDEKRIAIVKSLTSSVCRVQLASESQNYNEYNLKKIRIDGPLITIPLSKLGKKFISFKHSSLFRDYYVMKRY